MPNKQSALSILEKNDLALASVGEHAASIRDMEPKRAISAIVRFAQDSAPGRELSLGESVLHTDMILAGLRNNSDFISMTDEEVTNLLESIRSCPMNESPSTIRELLTYEHLKLDDARVLLTALRDTMLSGEKAGEHTFDETKLDALMTIVCDMDTQGLTTLIDSAEKNYTDVQIGGLHDFLESVYENNPEKIGAGADWLDALRKLSNRTNASEEDSSNENKEGEASHETQVITNFIALFPEVSEAVTAGKNTLAEVAKIVRTKTQEKLGDAHQTPAVPADQDDTIRL